MLFLNAQTNLIKTEVVQNSILILSGPKNKIGHKIAQTIFYLAQNMCLGPRYIYIFDPFQLQYKLQKQHQASACAHWLLNLISIKHYLKIVIHSSFLLNSLILSMQASLSILDPPFKNLLKSPTALQQSGSRSSPNQNTSR